MRKLLLLVTLFMSQSLYADNVRYFFSYNGESGTLHDLDRGYYRIFFDEPGGCGGSHDVAACGLTSSGKVYAIYKDF